MSFDEEQGSKKKKLWELQGTASSPSGASGGLPMMWHTSRPRASVRTSAIILIIFYSKPRVNAQFLPLFYLFSDAQAGLKLNKSEHASIPLPNSIDSNR